MSDSVFWECKSRKCERSGRGCIIVMPDTSRYDRLFDKGFHNVDGKIPIICPFLEQMDGDNAEWEQITRVTITRKY